MKRLQEFFLTHFPPLLGILIAILIALFTIQAIISEVRAEQTKQELVTCQQQLVDQVAARVVDKATHVAEIVAQSFQAQPECECPGVTMTTP